MREPSRVRSMSASFEYFSTYVPEKKKIKQKKHYNCTTLLGRDRLQNRV